MSTLPRNGDVTALNAGASARASPHGGVRRNSAPRTRLPGRWRSRSTGQGFEDTHRGADASYRRSATRGLGPGLVREPPVAVLRGPDMEEAADTHLREILQHALRSAVFAAEEDADEGLRLVQARLDRVDVALRGATFPGRPQERAFCEVRKR